MQNETNLVRFEFGLLLIFGKLHVKITNKYLNHLNKSNNVCWHTRVMQTGTTLQAPFHIKLQADKWIL